MQPDPRLRGGDELSDTLQRADRTGKTNRAIHRFREPGFRRTHMHHRTPWIIAALTTLTFPLVFASGDPPAKPVAQPPAGERLPADLSDAAHEAIRRGLTFLKSTQEEPGGWTSRFGPGVSAIVTQAFIQSSDYGPKHPVVRRATGYIMSFAKPDGGIYQSEMSLHNYQTSVVLMMLAAADDPAQRDTVAKARDFLKRLQYDESESIDAADPWYGGAGYTDRKRPDLSNTQMMLDALHHSGLPVDDPTYQKALKFISRCQMLDAANDQPFADGATDGGFIYSPANGGESKAGEIEIGGKPRLRSYGSMTYAGFKSMLYAGVDRNDPRVRAAVKWIARNWTLDANPNMPGAQSIEGLYYYYHVFAKAMRAWGEPVIEDDRGVKHNWRVELIRKLLSLQNKDGSWVNSKDRWAENDPNYVTALAILAMQEALRD